MRRKYIILGLIILIINGYIYGIVALYYEKHLIPSKTFSQAYYISLIMIFTGLLSISYGILAPSLHAILKTGSESIDIACDFKGRKSLCQIRFEGELNEKLLNEIANYYVGERGYKYVGEKDDKYVFYRGVKGFKDLWSKSVKIYMWYEEIPGGIMFFLEYRIGLSVNPLIRGDVLQNLIEAEVLGLYRYIRLRWSNIYGERVSKTILLE